MDLRMLVEKELNGHPRCYGHCKEVSTLKILNEKPMMTGCYSCPSGYVSRIVGYGKQLDLNVFKTTISAAAQGMGDVTDEDIRVATRYAWDLGIKQEPEGVVLKEVYWMQNYRRTKSEDPNRLALFLCTNCMSFYSQPVTSQNSLCPRCRAVRSQTRS